MSRERGGSPVDWRHYLILEVTCPDPDTEAVRTTVAAHLGGVDEDEWPELGCTPLKEEDKAGGDGPSGAVIMAVAVTEAAPVGGIVGDPEYRGCLGGEED